MLLDTEHTQLPSRSLLLLRWMGPSKVLARTAPNTYRLNVPATERTCAEFNIERLRPYLHRPDHLPVGGAAAPPPPVVGTDGRPEHDVQELLKFKMRWGRPYVLVRWAGHDASGDTWAPLDNLTNREEAVAAFERATCRSLPPPRHAAAGRRRRAAADSAGRFHRGPRATGRSLALVGRTILHWWWPEDGLPGATARRRRPPLPAWRVPARVGAHPSVVGAARHGRHASRRCVSPGAGFVWPP